MTTRPDRLPGNTYKLKMQGQTAITVYLTINSLPGDEPGVLSPYEVFINTKNAEMVEHLMAVTILISKGLQRGDSLEAIGKDLMEIASQFTAHMKKGGMSKSMYARIGETLIEHARLLSEHEATEKEVSA